MIKCISIQYNILYIFHINITGRIVFVIEIPSKYHRRENQSCLCCLLIQGVSKIYIQNAKTKKYKLLK